MASTVGEPQPLLFRSLKPPKQVFRDLRNYLAGQFVGATRDDALLDEVLKCLFCKLYLETSSAPPLPSGDAFERARHLRGIFRKVRADFPDIYETDAEILLDPEALSVVLDECYFSLLEAATDPIGDAFEVFVGSESRGRSGQFFTPPVVTDLLVRAVDPKAGERVVDPACGAGGFLAAVAHHLRAAGVAGGELAQHTTSSLFGVDKDDYLVKLARLHISLFTKGHPHIICGDSIALTNGSTSLGKELPRESFDVVLTNPPFGVKIVAAKPEVMRHFSLAKKWRHDATSDSWQPTAELQNNVPPQVVFVERCLSLLRPAGRLGMVVPESLLSTKSYRHVVQHLLEAVHVRAVIGMPESLFKTSGKGGTHTKTCLLVAEKKGAAPPRRRSRIFMAEARWCGHDSRARSIPNNDLPTIERNLERFRRGDRSEDSPLGFVVELQALRSRVLCPRYYDPQISKALSDLENTHELVVFGDLVKKGTLSLSTGVELGKLAYGTGDVPFVRTSDLSNWEIKADPKHVVDRKLFESLKGKQDVRPHDILMVKDGTYLIGTCALVSEYDTEIIYQSHIYKIRIQDQAVLNPFLLLAILSCPVVQRQVRAKQFTQDIIDSLGERVHELILPIPRSKTKRAAVTDMVKTAVTRRIEARELARAARLAVATV